MKSQSRAFPKRPNYEWNTEWSSLSGLRHGFILTSFFLALLMISSCNSTSRPTTASELEVHEEFLDKLDSATINYHQQIKDATSDVERKLDSLRISNHIK